MSDFESKWLERFLSEQLFCSLYPALCFMEEHYQAPSPTRVWLKALQYAQKIGEIPRADLILERMFINMPKMKALCVEAVLFYMLMAGGKEALKPTPLKDKLAKLLLGHGESWQILYQHIRQAELEEEQNGNFVGVCDYQTKENQLAMLVREEVEELDGADVDLAQGQEIVREIVDNCMGLTTNTIEGILVPLMSLNERHGMIFDTDINRLKEKLGIKTTTQYHFDRLNDIHDNKEVKIGK